MLQDKWWNMTQKLAINYLLKETLTNLDSLNETLYRQNCYQEVILREAKVSAFSFRDDQNQNPQKKKKYSFNQGVFWELKNNVQAQSDITLKRVHDLLENERDLCKTLQMEREKNDSFKAEVERLNFLLNQQSKERILGGIQNESHDDLHQESYIEEIETQLQEARAALLETKCQLSDRDEDIRALENQIQLLESNIRSLTEEKKGLDEFIIQVSQELKSKEAEKQQLLPKQVEVNYQLALEKEHLMKQLEMAKKELVEEKSRQKNLEIVETNLVHQLQNKEQENLEMKSFLHELEEKLLLKTDAIEKAQKVIQKLNEELEKTTIQLEKTEGERDSLRRECKEQNKRVLELNKQVQQQMNQHYQNSAQANSQLKTEVEELKEVLKQYQNEYELEKRQLTETVRNLNEQKYQLQIDRDKIEINGKKQQKYFQEQLDQKEEAMKRMEDKIDILEREVKLVEEDYKRQIETKESQAQSNILYLQKRIKELSYEVYKSQNLKGENKIEALSYLSTVKTEFDKVSKEVVELKKFIKQECFDRLGFTQKIKFFEEFQITVMGTLMEWERKTSDLQQFIKQQQGAQEEQKQIFTKLKEVVKHKDSLIYQYQKQIQEREQQMKAQLGTIKRELERSNYLIRTDLMSTVIALDKENQHLANDTYDIEKRFQNFRLEFSQVLDDRDHARNENLRLIGEIETIKKDINKIDDEFFTFKEKIRAILEIKKSGENGHVLIVPTLENLIEELQLRKQESNVYSAQIEELQRQGDDEKRFLQGKIKAVEDQIEYIQRQSISKEEEQQVQFLQKETRYVNDIQKLQADLSSSQNEVQVRERQLKKMQQKLDLSQYEVQCLLKEVEKQKSENLDLYEREQRTNADIKFIQESLEKSQYELDEKIRILTEMETQLQNIEEKCRILKETIKDLEAQVSKEKELNLQLQEEKYKLNITLETTQDKNKILDKENQNLYNEVNRSKSDNKDLLREYEKCNEERSHLTREVEIMNKAIGDAQNEILQSQKIIEQLTEALEESKSKDYLINDLKYEIRQLKSNEVKQYDMITELKLKLFPSKSHAETQTPESGIQEIYYLRDELQKLTNDLIGHRAQGDQLREMIQRQSQQIDRLIEEKRDYENIIEQQNQSLKQQKIQSVQTSNPYKENYNTQNSITVSAHKGNNNTTLNTSSFGLNSNELYSQILQEKENYIMRLEQEISEMRKDNEHLKEKIVEHEVGTLTLDQQQFQDQNLQLRQQVPKNMMMGYYQQNSSQQQIPINPHFQSKKSGSVAQSTQKQRVGFLTQSHHKQPIGYQGNYQNNQNVTMTPIHGGGHSIERLGSNYNMHNKSMQYHL